MNSCTVQSRCLRFHYWQAGNGRPLILLHGFPQVAYEWHHLVRALSDEFAVFAPDTRGFGGTDKPRLRVTRDLLARDLIDFMDALGIERASLAGHDWGGMIAAKAVLEHPERFERVAFLDTTCTVWIPWALNGYWFKVEGLAEEFFAKHHRAFIDLLFAGVPADYPGPPVTPWLNRLPSGADPGRIFGAEALDHYRRAYADPDTHFHCIQYYRYGAPFHRRRGGALEFMPESEVARMWRHPGGIKQHPEYGEYLVYAPEDAHLRYRGPSLFVYTPTLVPGAFDPARPLRTFSDGNPAAEAFVTHFPALQAIGHAGSHFVPEEAPQKVERWLRKWLARPADAPGD